MDRWRQVQRTCIEAHRQNFPIYVIWLCGLTLYSGASTFQNKRSVQWVQPTTNNFQHNWAQLDTTPKDSNIIFVAGLCDITWCLLEQNEHFFGPRMHFSYACLAEICSSSVVEYTFTGRNLIAYWVPPAHNEVAFTAGFAVDLVATLELFGLYVHMAIFSKILHQHINKR